MLGLGALQLSCGSSSALASSIPNPTSFSHLISSKIYKTSSLFLHSNACFNDFLLQGRTGFSVFASKKHTKGNNTLLEVDDYDDEEEEEEDEDEMDVPLANMKKWLEDKPPGFGEGKEYDTSIEDKLFEELEQSRRAQLANINKLKNNPPNPDSNKQQQVQKAPEAVPIGIRVRVGNLPKKKNIHKDLKLAFKGFPGIVNISPAVSGNKKTRDPVCKGFAFIDLDSEDAASRFIHIYSRQSMPFGKLQKQITCEMINPRDSRDYTFKQSEKGASMSTPEIMIPSMEEDPVAESDMGNLSLDSWEVTSSDESAGDQIISAEWKEVREDLERVNMREPIDNDIMRPRTVPATDSAFPKQQQKKRAVQKKQIVKRKSVKVSKLNIPGSAKRLKIKEKAVLTGVLSKYGAKAPSTSGEER